MACKYLFVNYLVIINKNVIFNLIYNPQQALINLKNYMFKYLTIDLYNSNFYY